MIFFFFLSLLVDLPLLSSAQPTVSIVIEYKWISSQPIPSIHLPFPYQMIACTHDKLCHICQCTTIYQLLFRTHGYFYMFYRLQIPGLLTRHRSRQNQNFRDSQTKNTDSSDTNSIECWRQHICQWNQSINPKRMENGDAKRHENHNDGETMTMTPQRQLRKRGKTWQRNTFFHKNHQIRITKTKLMINTFYYSIETKFLI